MHVGCDIVVNVFVQATDHQKHNLHEAPKDTSVKSSAKQRVQDGEAGPQMRAAKNMMLDNVMIDVNGMESSQLQVARIHEGAIAKWNKTHPDMQVRVGDHIVRVNDHKGAPADLAGELAATSGDITILMRRPSILPPRSGHSGMVPRKL